VSGGEATGLGQCDYGGCGQTAVYSFHAHGDDHQFCEYHNDEVSL